MKKRFVGYIGWVLGFLALFLLSFRIYRSFSKSEFQNSVQSLILSKNIFYIIGTFILMFINWLIESIKWYKISRLSENISFKNAIYSVLTGLAFGHLLPGRSSEFYGKILFFSDKNKANITVLHFVNASFQLYITLVTGLLMMVFYMDVNGLQYPHLKIIFLFGMVLALLLSGLIIYIDKFSLLKKFFPLLSDSISHSLKLELLLWSLLRYFVFILQFYLVFLIFKPYQVLNMFFVSHVAVYFLLTSVIPMVSVMEVAIRALIGVFSFRDLNISDVNISIITTLIWMVNLAVPSIVGFLIWLYFKQTRWR